MTLSSQNSNVYVPCWLMLYNDSSLCLTVNVLAASGQASAQMLGTPLSVVGVNPNPVEWNENQATINQSTTTSSAVSQPTSSLQTNSTSNLPSNTSNQQVNSQLISTSDFFVIAGALNTCHYRHNMYLFGSEISETSLGENKNCSNIWLIKCSSSGTGCSYGRVKSIKVYS